MKNNHINYFLYWVSGILLGNFFYSCNEDCTPHPEKNNLTLTYDWKKITKPPGMRILIYSQSSKIDIDSIISSDGVRMTIAPGFYQFLSFNNNTTNIQFNGLENFNTAEAFMVSMRSSEPIFEQPDMLYSVSLDELSVAVGQPIERELEIHRLVKPIRLIIQMDNVENIRSCNGSLSGISKSINMRTGIPSLQNPGTVLFEPSKTSKGNFTTIIQVFGTAAGADSTNILIYNFLELSFAMDNGTNERVKLNISSILQQMDEDGITIALVISSIQGVGLTSTIAGWQNGIGSGQAN